jgi:hypothetical protein
MAMLMTKYILTQMTLIYEMLPLCILKLCWNQTALTIILFNRNWHCHVYIIMWVCTVLPKPHCLLIQLNKWMLTMCWYSAQILITVEVHGVTAVPALLYSECDIIDTNRHLIPCPTEQKWFSCSTGFYWLVSPNLLFYSCSLAVLYCTTCTVILLNVYELFPNCNSFSS